MKIIEIDDDIDIALKRWMDRNEFSNVNGVIRYIIHRSDAVSDVNCAFADKFKDLFDEGSREEIVDLIIDYFKNSNEALRDLTNKHKGETDARK